MSKIRAFLVDDHYVTCYGLRRMLEQEEDLCVVGEAQNGEEAWVFSPTGNDQHGNDHLAPCAHLAYSNKEVCFCPGLTISLLSSSGVTRLIAMTHFVL